MWRRGCSATLGPLRGPDTPRGPLRDACSCAAGDPSVVASHASLAIPPASSPRGYREQHGQRYGIRQHSPGAVWTTETAEISRSDESDVTLNQLLPTLRWRARNNRVARKPSATQEAALGCASTATGPGPATSPPPSPDSPRYQPRPAKPGFTNPTHTRSHRQNWNCAWGSSATGSKTALIFRLGDPAVPDLGDPTIIVGRQAWQRDSGRRSPQGTPGLRRIPSGPNSRWSCRASRAEVRGPLPAE